MSRQTGHGIIIAPILCLLIAPIAFVYALTWGNNARPAAETVAVEKTPTPPVDRQIFYAPSPSEAAETSPLVEDWVCPLTDEEVELIALLTMAEAEGESEYGQRLVIDTVLNRMDSEYFPDTVYDVIYQKNQYSAMTDERAARCLVKEELCELVRSELKERTDYDVVFFRTERFHSFGVPLFQVGAHYFSKYG